MYIPESGRICEDDFLRSAHEAPQAAQKPFPQRDAGMITLSDSTNSSDQFSVLQLNFQNNLYVFLYISQEFAERRKIGLMT